MDDTTKENGNPQQSPESSGTRRRWTQLAADIPRRRSSNEVDERPPAPSSSSLTSPAAQKPLSMHHGVPPPTIDQIQALAPPNMSVRGGGKSGHKRTYTSELIVGWRSVSNADLSPSAAAAMTAKRVMFSHQTTVDYVGFVYSDEEKKKCWYTRKELNKSLAKELKQILKQMNDPFFKDDNDRPDATCSSRGIEHMTSPTLLRTLQKNKARVCRSVKKEQNRQDALGIFCDLSLAQVSLKYSRRASDLAAYRGEADALAVKAMEQNRRRSARSLHRRLRSDSLAEAALDLAVLPVMASVANVQEASIALGVQDASALPELTEGAVVEPTLPDNMEWAAVPPAVETVVPAAAAETSTSLMEALDLPSEGVVSEHAVAIVMAEMPEHPVDLAAAATEALATAKAITDQEAPSSPLAAVFIDGNLSDAYQDSNGEVIINYEQLGVAMPQELQQAAPVVALGDAPEDLSLASPVVSIQTF